MNQIFEHYLVTRLNVGYKEKIWLPYENPEEWLTGRIELFYKFCLPSVLNQSNKGFKWILYIDDLTPDEVFDSILGKLKNLDFVIILRKKESVKHFYRYFSKDINNIVSKNVEYLITTTVDTDDLIHRDYINLIQSHFNFQEYLPLNFNNGLIYDVNTGVVSKFIHRSNMFISLIEKRKSNRFQGVSSRSHTDYRHDANKLEIYNSVPMWSLSVHNLNVSSQFSGRVFFLKSPILKELFNFDFQIQPSFDSKISLARVSLGRWFKFFKSSFRRFIFNNKLGKVVTGR